MTTNNSVVCPWSSAPDCTYGLDYQRGICNQLHPRSTTAISPAMAQCILERLTPLEQATLATFTYALTLWPAFIGIICSFGPDPSDIVYDNVWWAILFAATCGALPGLSNERPPHHMVVDSTTEGRQACTAWQHSSHRPRIRARHTIPTEPPQRKAAQLTELFLFILVSALYLWFCILFGIALNNAFVIKYPNTVYALWYYFAAGPAFGTLLSEAIQDRVDLYEPDTRTSWHHQSPMLLSETSLKSTVHNAVYSSTAALAIGAPRPSTTAFHRVPDIGFFTTWLRVLAHQCRRTPYRLLVRPPSRKWPFAVWRSVIALLRVALFAIGYILMGQIMFLPTRDQTLLFVLLIFVSALPRFSWPSLWARSPHAADLVVLVKPVEYL